MGKLLLLILVSLGLVSTVAILENGFITTVQAQSVPYFVEPTPDPKTAAGIIMTTGHTLQPNSDNNIKLGKSVTLTTDAKRGFLAALKNPAQFAHYQWYKLEAGDPYWTPVDAKDGGNNQNLTVTPKSVGTTYYQQKVQWYLIFASKYDTMSYSKVATVTCQPRSIPATSVTVTTDKSYLYNNLNDTENRPIADTAYAHLQTEPQNATREKITWSIDRPDLASIDPDTGLISANTNNKSGIVFVTGSFTNDNGITVNDSSEIDIGGGLDDVVVDEGKDATFKIKGNFDQTPDSITWHRVEDNQDTVVNGANGLTYTKVATTVKDDLAQFYATVVIKSGKKAQVFKTSHASLFIIKDKDPRINIKNTILNNSYTDPNSTETNVHNVNADDTLTYKMHITDENEYSLLKVLTAAVDLPLSKVLRVQDNGQDIPFIVTNSDETSNVLIAPTEGINFINKKDHQINITFSVAKKAPAPSQIIPVIRAVPTNDLVDHAIKNIVKINYSVDTINLTAQNIDFGVINSYSQNKIIDHQENKDGSDIFLDIEDDRRNKTPADLSISLTSPMTSDKNILPADLRYYFDDQSFKTIDKSGILVKHFNANEKMEPIRWNKKIGLKLHIQNKVLLAGNYTGQLTWEVKWSI